MLGIGQRILNDPKNAKFLEWGRLVSITGSAQMLVQLIGFACGIIVIRLLPAEEYAFYTIANTMLGTMTILADGGIASGVMAQGGKVWQDREKLGAVLATGIDLRKKFAIGSLLVAVPIMMYLLIYHNASWLMASLIVLSLIPAFLTALSGTLLEIAPKLHQDIPPLQKIQVGVNGGRLVMLGLTLFIFPWAFVAVMASGITQVWANLNMRKISKSYADLAQTPDPVVRKEILSVVKRILPDSIYYCLSGQITIWIISLFGSTTSLAQLGALGRLSMLFNMFVVIFSTLASPRFARMPYIRVSVVKRFIHFQLIMIAISVLMTGGFYLFSDQLLWVLGPTYKGLNKEILMIAISGSIMLLNMGANNLLASRGLVVPPVLFIPLAIIVQVAFAFVVKLDDVTGVILYGIYTTAIMYLIRLAYFFITIRKLSAYS